MIFQVFFIVLKTFVHGREHLHQHGTFVFRRQTGHGCNIGFQRRRLGETKASELQIGIYSITFFRPLFTLELFVLSLCYVWPCSPKFHIRIPFFRL